MTELFEILAQLDCFDRLNPLMHVVKELYVLAEFVPGDLEWGQGLDGGRRGRRCLSSSAVSEKS